MDLHQLKTFVTVAREGSVTRASALLHLSQPAVSAHIKAMEDALGLELFKRTPRGMSLTRDGERLLAKAEQTLTAHQELLAEASRAKGEVSGTLRICASTSTKSEPVGKLLTTLAERWPDVEVSLQHRTSAEVLAGLRSGGLDAGFYNEPGEPDADLATIDVGEFAVYVVAAPGLVTPAEGRLNWAALADLPWIYPTAAACCNRTAERLFAAYGFRPRRIVSADRQDVTKTLVTSGIGVGLLHADTAESAARHGELELLFEAETRVRVCFAHLARRADEPAIAAAASVMRARTSV